MEVVNIIRVFAMTARTPPTQKFNTCASHNVPSFLFIMPITQAPSTSPVYWGLAFGALPIMRPNADRDHHVLSVSRPYVVRVAHSFGIGNRQAAVN
jgi:hypothetical protein